MLQRFGWPGFIAFAIPNVLGCAAFGYVLKNRAQSEAIVARHSTAMVWFSVITVAYQIFFMFFLLADVFALPGELGLVPLLSASIVMGLGLVLSFLPDRDWLVLGLITYAVSVTAFAVIGAQPLEGVNWVGERNMASLLWLTPTLFFGFLLCPYLDLTFHRAIQRSPSRHSFAVFGLAFAAMLVLSSTMWAMRPVMLPMMAIAHIVAQLTFTAGAHLREIRLSPALSGVNRLLAMVGPFVVVVMMEVVRSLGSIHHAGFGPNAYIRWLVFYGLLFPAYVAMFMRSGMDDANRKVNRAVFWVVVVLSVPLYEIGFVQGRTWVLVIPMTLVLGLGVVIPRKTGLVTLS
jgi:hypothetical protein